MAQNKRKDYLLKQGYSLELINILESCGVTKHMLWFLNQLRNNERARNITESMKSDIKVINEHIESKGKNVFRNMEEAFKSVYAEKARKNAAMKKALYAFKDGHSIVLLEPRDLHMESINMSNCVGGYVSRIESKEKALLALKSPEGDTLVHFELLKNGMLSQNFEKANMPVRHKYWKYIYEFFKQNSKNIPASKHLGFAWDAAIHWNDSGYHMRVDCVMPTKISKYIDRNGQLATSIEKSNILKTFNIQIPRITLHEFDKNVFVKKLKLAKTDIIKAFDDIISNVEITEGENLYVSDKTKDIVFENSFYLMKGEEYNANDMTVLNDRPNVAEEVPMGEMMEEPAVEEMGDIAMEEPVQAEEPAEEVPQGYGGRVGIVLEGRPIMARARDEYAEQAIGREPAEEREVYVRRRDQGRMDNDDRGVIER